MNKIVLALINHTFLRV